VRKSKVVSSFGFDCGLHLFFFDFRRLEQSSFCSFLRFQKVVGLVQLAELSFMFVNRAVF